MDLSYTLFFYWPQILFGLWCLQIFTYFLSYRVAVLYQQKAAKVFTYRDHEILTADKHVLPLLKRKYFQILTVMGISFLILSWFDTGFNTFIKEIFIGMLFFSSLVTSFRLFYNLIIYFYANNKEFITGKIDFSRKMNAVLNGLQWLFYAVLLMVAALLTGSMFLMGGALGQLLLAALELYKFKTKETFFTTQPKEKLLFKPYMGMVLRRIVFYEFAVFILLLLVNFISLTLENDAFVSFWERVVIATFLSLLGMIYVGIAVFVLGLAIGLMYWRMNQQKAR